MRKRQEFGSIPMGGGKEGRGRGRRGGGGEGSGGGGMGLGGRGSVMYNLVCTCSYSEWPVSWMAPVRPSVRSCSLNRVVMRTSVGWVPAHTHGHTLRQSQQYCTSRLCIMTSQNQQEASVAASVAIWCPPTYAILQQAPLTQLVWCTLKHKQ